MANIGVGLSKRKMTLDISRQEDSGRWKEAEELEVKVMETRKRVLGQEHPGTLASMANLASTYRNQGRWKEAEELVVKVMETSSKVLGPRHAGEHGKSVLYLEIARTR
jgi:hypothetical protein